MSGRLGRCLLPAVAAALLLALGTIAGLQRHSDRFWGGLAGATGTLTR